MLAVGKGNVNYRGGFPAPTAIKRVTFIYILHDFVSAHQKMAHGKIKENFIVRRRTCAN